MIKKDKTQFIATLSLKEHVWIHELYTLRKRKTRIAKTKSIAIERQQLPEAMTRVQGRAI